MGTAKARKAPAVADKVRAMVALAPESLAWESEQPNVANLYVLKISAVLIFSSTIASASSSLAKA